MTAFLTHPSVRIKGTENNYEPVICVHPKCADRAPHMHCPFCVKTEPYPDPVILKAHYRVKHVDKGLDFAGLKILRCCDHCEIVGTIKGEKKFKGPHWHCYKCRNGFNRRDEAIKHYRTHFRNPQTTFQIQVAQEVNIMLNNMNSSESSEAVEHIGDHNDFSMHGSLVSGPSDGYYSTDSYSNLSKADSSSVQVAANETVDASDAQTIMIIQDRDGQPEYHESSLIGSEQQVSYDELLQHKHDLENHIESLEADIKMVENYRMENERLKQQNEELSRKNEKLSRELMSAKAEAGPNFNQRIESLVDELQTAHKTLLIEHLARISQEQTLLEGSHSPGDNGQLLSTVHITEEPSTKRIKTRNS